MIRNGIGIGAKDIGKIAKGLGKRLVNYYSLSLQVHNFQSKFAGPQFRELHLLLEEHYTEPATAVDEIAEWI